MKNFNSVVTFKKCGCDNEELGDIKNPRITSEIFRNKNGLDTVLEIGFNYRIFKEKNKKCLCVHVYTYQDNECTGDWNFEVDILKKELEYNQKNVLKVLNMASKERFTEIEII